MDAAVLVRTFAAMTDQPIPEMTAGEAMLFAGLLTAHGGTIGPDTINGASTIFAHLREHIGQRWPGVRPEAAALVLALLRHSTSAAQQLGDMPADLVRAYFETGGATEPVGDSQRAPHPEEVAEHVRDLHGRYHRQRETISAYQQKNDETSRALTEIAEKLGLAPRGRLVNDADLLAEIGSAVDNLLVRAYVAESETVPGLVIPAGYGRVTPTRPDRWAIGNRHEVFESTDSLADAIKMCRDTLARRRARIG